MVHRALYLSIGVLTAITLLGVIWPLGSHPVQDAELASLTGRTGWGWCNSGCTNCSVAFGEPCDSPEIECVRSYGSCPLNPIYTAPKSPEICDPEMGNEMCSDSPDDGTWCAEVDECHCRTKMGGGYECFIFAEGNNYFDDAPADSESCDSEEAPTGARETSCT